MPRKAPQADGNIQRGVVYTLPQFEKITGLGRTAQGQAKDDGLAVLYYGNRAFITGDAWIQFLESVGQTKRPQDKKGVAK